MELHHSKHHNTYVTSYNTQIEKLQEAQQKGDIQAQIAIQPLINFHGGTRVRNPPLSLLSKTTHTRYASCKTKRKTDTRNLLSFLGGHTNHTLFWENLAPKSQGGGEPPSGSLSKAIDASYGSLDKLKSQFNAALAGIQGSGWAWLVQDTHTGAIQIKTYANQDPVVGQFRPILGIDAWEHAYYLQYQNRKAEYFSAIWDVVNWKAAEKRFK